MVGKDTNKRIGEVEMEIFREVQIFTTQTKTILVISRGGTIMAWWVSITFQNDWT
jgi:thiamine biosynthesis protein ThiC